MSSEILAVVEATPARRVIGVAMLGMLGALLLYVALNATPGLGALLFLIVCGCGSLWLSVRLWQSTLDRVELTEEELRTGSGEVIARVEDIESVDRGFFAFKPSNGFVVTLKQRSPRAWNPGLWWRLGRRVGVGGVTPGVQGKGMADMLSGLIAVRGIEDEAGQK
jgi:hypothetical protein